MTAEQTGIAFATYQSSRLTILRVFGPTITATTEELLAAANAMLKVFGAPEGDPATITEIEQADDNAYIITSAEGEHSNAIGNFVIAIVAWLGWSREATVVAELLSDGTTQRWSLGQDGKTPDWVRIPVE